MYEDATTENRSDGGRRGKEERLITRMTVVVFGHFQAARHRHLSTMPPKQTYQQIKERNEREIRMRTKDRISALMVEMANDSARKRRKVVAESDVVVVECDEENSQDERPYRNAGVEAFNTTLSKRCDMSPPCVVCLRRQVYWTACVRLSSVLLFLFLIITINRMYHTRTNEMTQAPPI